jgi:hypothetical protein
MLLTERGWRELLSDLSALHDPWYSRGLLLMMYLLQHCDNEGHWQGNYADFQRPLGLSQKVVRGSSEALKRAAILRAAQNARFLDLTIVNYQSYELPIIEKNSTQVHEKTENGQLKRGGNGQLGSSHPNNIGVPLGNLKAPLQEAALRLPSGDPPPPPPPPAGEITDLTNTELGLVPTSEDFDEQAVMDKWRGWAKGTPLQRADQLMLQRVVQILHRSPDIRLTQKDVETILRRWCDYGWPIKATALLSESQYHPGAQEWEVMLHKAELKETKSKGVTAPWKRAAKT